MANAFYTPGRITPLAPKARRPYSAAPLPVDPRLARSQALLASIGKGRTAQPIAVQSEPIDSGGGHGGLGGIASSLKRMAMGVPQGVAHLVAGGALTAAGLPRALIDVGTGRAGELVDEAGGWKGRDVYNQANLTPQTIAYMKSQGLDPGQRTGGFRQVWHEYAPIVEEIEGSIQHGTIPRLAQLAQLDPSAYVQAYNQGNLPEVLVEDIGNIALVGSAATKALGAVPLTVDVPNTALKTVLEGGVNPRSLGAAAAEDTAGGLANTIPAPRMPGAALSEGGEVVEMSTQATIPGRGLAGYLHGQGMEVAARRVAGAAHRIEQVTRLGEEVSNAQMAWPARGLSYLARKSGLPRLAETGLTRWASHTVEAGGALSKVAERFTPEWRSTVQTAREARAYLGRELTANERRLLYARKLQESAGLTREEARASTFAVDDRFTPAVMSYRSAIERGLDPDAVMGPVLERAYPNLPDALRPTVDDVRAFVEWKDGKLDDTRRSAMDRIEQSVRQNSEVLTAEEQRMGLLDDEQLGNEYLSEPLASIQGRLESGRDRVQRNIDRKFAQGVREQRRADINQALTDWTEPPPDPRQALKTGRKAGILEARSAGARREHAKAQRELARAVDEYTAAEARGESDATLAKLSTELDRKVARAEAIRDEIKVLDRRRQAAEPLSRVIDREVSAGETAPRPEPISGPEYTVSQIRDAHAAVRDTHTQDARAYIETLTAGERLRTPSEARPNMKGEMGGEWDWWQQLSPADRAVMIREKFLVSKTPREKKLTKKQRREAVERQRVDEQGNKPELPPTDEGVGGGGYRGEEVLHAQGLDPDQFAANMSERLGRDLSVDEAVQLYVDAVRGWADARDAGSAVATGQIADQLGLPKEVVHLAITGTAADFKGAMRDYAVAALDDMQTAFASADPTTAGALLDELKSLRENGASPEDIGDFMEGALDAVDADTRGILEPVWSTVDMGEIADWLTGKEISPAIWETTLGQRGAVQQRILAKMHQTQISLRGELTRVNQDYRQLSSAYDAAQRNVDRTVRQTARTVNAAASHVERARIASTAANAAEEAFVREVDEVATSGEGWRRRGVSKKQIDAIRNDPELTERQKQYRIDAIEQPMSPSERLMIRKGAFRDRALAHEAALGRMERNAARWNERIADLPTELARSFQQRLVEDINAPAIGGVKRTLRSTVKPLGSVVESTTEGGNPTITGMMGRLANEYGIGDEVIAAFDQVTMIDGGQLAPLDARRAFQVALDEAGISLDDLEHTERIDLEMAANVDQMLYDIGQIEDHATETGTLLWTPLRVRDYFNSYRMERQIPADVIAQIDKRFEQYIKRRNNHLTKALDDYTAVMPGRYRAVGINARRDVRGLLDEAEAYYAKGDIDTAHNLIQMAEEVPTTLQQIIAAGIDPTHLTGGEAPTTAPSIGGTGISVRSLRATQKLTTGLRPVDLAGVVQLEISETNKILVNRTAELLKVRAGRRVDEIIADEVAQWHADHPFDDFMPAREIEERLHKAGYVVATGEAGPPNRSTIAVPLAVANEMKAYGVKGGAIWQTVHAGNRLFKTSVLPFSPKWHLGNIVGNTFMAMTYGKMGPLELARTMDYIAKSAGGWKEFMRQQGKPFWAPDDLATHGFTYNEHVLRWGDDGIAGLDQIDQPGAIRDHFNRFVATSYNINEFFDNATRSSVFLSGLRKGMSVEQAMKHSLQAMGDFTRMSPFEKHWMREAFPFYAWMRHQTQAALRLPLYSPTRAAWLLHITNLMNDPEMGPDMLAQLGGKIPLGGKWFNVGGLDPFGNPLDLALDPSAPSFANALTPTVKLPFKLVTGMEVGGSGLAKSISRPEEQKPTGMFGETIPLSPVRRLLSDPRHALGEIGYQVAGELPQTKLLRDLALDVTGGNLGDFRYKSGDRGPAGFDKPKSLAATIAGGLGVPWTTPVDTDQLLRDQRDNARAARQRARG